MSNLPEETLVKFANNIFLPLKNGQCVTCMFVAGGGKRTIIKGYISEETILKDIFKDLYSKTLFVYVDPDEILETSNTHYLELIYNSLKKELEKKKIKSNTNHYHNYLLKIKDTLSEIVIQSWRVIFILNDLEFTMSLSPSIFMNLETIMAIEKSKIVYLFLSTTNLLDENVIKQFHNLKYAVSRNTLYFPLLNIEDARFLIKNIAQKMNLKLSEGIIKILLELGGGHPQLLKYSIHNLFEAGSVYLTNQQKAKNYLLNYYQNEIICADIWNLLNHDEKELLSQIITTGKIFTKHQSALNYLIKTKLVNKTINDGYEIFGLIFEKYIKNKLPSTKLIYDPESNRLFYGSINCEDKFTNQEFKLMVYFLNHNQELVSRDQVAEIIWGKYFYQEKYSDYSIDKIISTIRKKLDALGYPSRNLTTLKKRGFSFSNQ